MSKKPVMLLSIDPSLTSTGYAVWEVADWQWTKNSLLRYGCYETDIGDGSTGERLDLLVGTVREIIKDWFIEEVVYEKAASVNYAGRGQKNIDKYRNAVANVERACVDQVGRENVYGVTAPTWKGTANKKATLKEVNALLDLELKFADNDIADAMKIGIWFIERQRLHPIKHDFTG